MDKIDYSSLEVVISIFFLFFLSFFALFEAVLHRLSSFDLKLLSDQHRDKKNIVIHLLAGNDLDVIIPLKFGIQLAFIIIAILTTHIVLINITYLPLLWAFGIMFVINLVFRQLIPHIVSHKNPDKKLLSLLPLFSFFFPALKILSYPISLAVQTVEDAKTTPATEKSKEVVEKEIQALIDIGKEEEVFEKEEGELVRSVLEFGDTKAREVMTPRSQIVAVQENATIEEVRELMVQEKHSRIPVYRENLDQIVGLIYVRHLLTKCEEGKGDEPITDIMLPPVFVSEEKSLSELLNEIKRKRCGMVFVRNEYGGISGLITIEDLLEEIVGELSDEDQSEKEEIFPQGMNTFLVAGNVDLYTLSETLEIRLEDEDCQTIGGLVTKIMGRLPRKNEKIEISGLTITVLHADSRKVNRLLVEKPPEVLNESSPSEKKD